METVHVTHVVDDMRPHCPSKVRQDRCSLEQDTTKFSLLEQGRAVGTILKESHVLTLLANFYTVIFFATCCVAKQTGYVEAAYEAEQAFLSRSGSEALSKSSLCNYEAAVKWIIKEMARQCRRGLQHRAFEIFFLG